MRVEGVSRNPLDPWNAEEGKTLRRLWDETDMKQQQKKKKMYARRGRNEILVLKRLLSTQE